MNVFRIKITSLNYLQLKHDFIEVINTGLPYFKFYHKRGYDHVLNINSAFLYYSGDEIIGYGHLDEDINSIWLGIMVKKNSRGKGFGKMILKDLINVYQNYSTSKVLKLAVDKKNIAAKELYSNSGFKLESTTENNHFMIFKT